MRNIRPGAPGRNFSLANRRESAILESETVQPEGGFAVAHARSRFEMLVGAEALAKLRRARVAVFGLGGVGCALAEALARAGVGHVDLVDDDAYSLTNLNRQLFATTKTLGEDKVTAAAARLREIDPACEVTEHRLFSLPETAGEIDLSVFDYIGDAIDTVAAKLELITRAKAADVPIVSCMGTGNRMDPLGLTVKDIYETQGDPLARIMRQELRKRGVGSLTVVCSDEPPLGPAADLSEPPETKGATHRPAPGSSPFVPPAAGFAMASLIVRALISRAAE